MSDCGKWKFFTRADAKRGRRSVYGRREGSKNGPLSIYWCDPCGAYHLGHLPADVRNGTLDKDEYIRAVTRVRD